MVDFVGRSRDTLEDMQRWGLYFGEADARAHNRWQMNEARTRYDEANRYNREGAISDVQFQTENAGLFNNMDTELAGLRPSGAPVATQPGGGSARAPGAPSAIVPIPPASRAPRAVPLQGSNTPQFDEQSVTGPIGIDPLSPSDMSRLSPEEYRAINNYMRARNNRRNPEAVRNAANRLRELGLEWRDAGSWSGADGTRQNRRQGIYRVRPNYSMESLRFPERGRDPTGPGLAGIGAAATSEVPVSETDEDPVILYNGPNTEDNGGRGLEPEDAPTDAWYNGAADTSRGLRPTREMRLIETAVRDSLRRADIAARHGQRAEAQQAFAQALQGQATLITQGRMQMYRAATGGSLAAQAALLAEFTGYPPGTVRIQPTDEQRTRFNLQIQNDAGEWITSSETPRTRDEILGGLLNLIDAEGAANRSEANMELMRAQIAAGADVQVATIGQRTAIMRMITDAQIARMNNTARQQLQNGQGEIRINNETGDAWFIYSDTDENGNTVPRVEVIQMQDVPSPDTRGRNTTRAPVSQRVTGIAGVQ